MLLKVTNPRTIFRAAMLCLVVFGVLGMPSLSRSLGENVVDGVRGALLGAAITLLFLAFRRQRRCEDGP